MLKLIFSKSTKDKVDRANYIKSLLILKDISNTSYGKQIKERNFLSKFDYLYTCRVLSKKSKCLIYKWRPMFCKTYHCYKSLQFAHADTNTKLGLPRLNISREELAEEITRKNEVYIGDLVFKDEEKKEECKQQ
jgi:Fe-S-cluster containining protein